MQVRLSGSVREWVTDLIVHLSEKKPKNTINESFNTLMSRERESVTWKVKKTREVRGQPFERDEKPWISKGNGPCSLLFSIM